MIDEARLLEVSLSKAFDPLSFAESKELARELISARAELERLREYVDSLPANWREDSSLETWFPLTAEENARMKAELERLRWRPITPEDFPKVGDELYGKLGRMTILSEGYAPVIPMMEDFTYAGWTHFRSHVAPPQKKKEEG